MVVNPEECPVPADLTIEGCSDSVVVDMGNVYLESLGRIIQMDVTIKNVCPGKRVALAAILTEVDENGMEYQRGSKAMTIRPITSPPAAMCWSNASSSCFRKILISLAAPPKSCATPAASRPGSSPTTSTATSAAVSLS